MYSGASDVKNFEQENCMEIIEKYNGFSIQQVTTIRLTRNVWVELRLHSCIWLRGKLFSVMYYGGAMTRVVLCNKAGCYHTCCSALSPNNTHTIKKKAAAAHRYTHIKKTAQIPPHYHLHHRTICKFNGWPLFEICTRNCIFWICIQAFVRIKKKCWDDYHIRLWLMKKAEEGRTWQTVFRSNFMYTSILY